MNNNIVRITKKTNVRVKNLHNEILFPRQDIMIIEFENGNSRIIDLFSQKDITNIDYFEIVETDKTKYKKIMEDSDFFELAF